TNSLVFFFFQAEDGIRDRNVTGVQTCALPICRLCAVAPLRPSRGSQRHRGGSRRHRSRLRRHKAVRCDREVRVPTAEQSGPSIRSEERRVGNEGRERTQAEQGEKKKTRKEARP